MKFVIREVALSQLFLILCSRRASVLVIRRLRRRQCGPSRAASRLWARWRLWNHPTSAAVYSLIGVSMEGAIVGQSLFGWLLTLGAERDHFSPGLTSTLRAR